MKLLVTGADGLLGKHFRAFCLAGKIDEVVTLNHSQFANLDVLKNSLAGCSAVVHFAGVNRGDDNEVYSQNLSITKQLIDALVKASSRAHLVFASSSHIDRDTKYGQAKRESSKLFLEWSKGCGAQFTELVLPHVFGEGGKPFYNSVVSTFCYQLANQEKLTVVKDSELELIHCLEVSKVIKQVLDQGQVGQIRVSGHKIKVTELKNKLETLSEKYLNYVIPRFANDFDLQLFNTLRSYLYPKKYPFVLEKKSDPRGYLFEAVKTENGGQGFLSTTLPNITRGNHWHLQKLERFCVIQGQAKIRIRSIFDNTIREFEVNGDQPCFVDIPTLHTHNITNVGDSLLLTMFWSHEIFNPQAPDTYSLMVDQPL